MSDLDESGMHSDDGGMESPQHTRQQDMNDADAALEAEAEAAYARHKQQQQQQRDAASDEYDEGADGLGPDPRMGGEHGAGFSSDDEGMGGGGDGGGADVSYDAGDAADYAQEEHDLEQQHDGDAGDPSSIHAPTGSSAATNEAAARLAKLLAADQEGGDDGEEDGGDPHDLEGRQQRKREIAELEAQLQRMGTGSARNSQRGSAKRRGDGEEKDSSFVDSRPPPRVASAKSSASHRPPVDMQGGGGGGGGGALDDEFDEDLGSEYDMESEYGEDGDEDRAGRRGGHGHGGDDDDDEVRTIEDVARAKEEREHLIEVNKVRQRQIALILEREKAAGGKGRGGGGGGSHDDKSSSTASASTVSDTASPEQLRSEYIKNLENLNLLWDELESKRERAEDTIDRLTYKLDAADARATELSDSFKSFVREVAKEARHARTGRPVKLKRILAFEAAEAQAEREVARVRLRHINLLQELRGLEESVRRKERLAEGLHLIDFEQLKIENQTLNEKIEERNDELHKLKKKTTTTVQVLTHIKEKLQCVREENDLAARELSRLNADVSSLRDQLTRTKHARDLLRHDNQFLKQKQGFIGSDMLVSDFEMRKGDIEVLRGEVDALKQRWRNLQQLASQAAHMERNQARRGGGGYGAAAAGGGGEDTYAGGGNTVSEQEMRQAHYAAVKFGTSGRR